MNRLPLCGSWIRVGGVFFLALICLGADIAPSELSRQQSAYYRLEGRRYQESGNLQEAVSSYRKAVAVNPVYADAYNDLGVALESLGDLIKAEEAYLSALKVNPDMGSAHSNLALLYERTGKLQDAAAHWTARVQLGPPNDSWVLKSYNKLVQYHLPVPEFSQLGIQKRRQESEAVYQAGCAHLKAKRWEDASAEFKRALDLDPRNSRAAAELRAVQGRFQNEQKTEEARQQAEQAKQEAMERKQAAKRQAEQAKQAKQETVHRKQESRPVPVERKKAVKTSAVPSLVELRSVSRSSVSDQSAIADANAVALELAREKTKSSKEQLKESKRQSQEMKLQAQQAKLQEKGIRRLAEEAKREQAQREEEMARQKAEEAKRQSQEAKLQVQQAKLQEKGVRRLAEEAKREQAQQSARQAAETQKAQAALLKEQEQMAKKIAAEEAARAQAAGQQVGQQVDAAKRTSKSAKQLAQEAQEQAEAAQRAAENAGQSEASVRMDAAKRVAGEAKRVEAAQQKAEAAKRQAVEAKQQAELARQQAEAARVAAEGSHKVEAARQAELARQQAEEAIALAEAAGRQSDAAWAQAAAAKHGTEIAQQIGRVTAAPSPPSPSPNPKDIAKAFAQEKAKEQSNKPMASVVAVPKKAMELPKTVQPAQPQVSTQVKAVAQDLEKDKEKARVNTIRELIQRGVSAVRQGRYEEATRHYEQVLMLDPKNTEAQQGLKRAQTAMAKAAKKQAQP